MQFIDQYVYIFISKCGNLQLASASNYHEVQKPTSEECFSTIQICINPIKKSASAYNFTIMNWKHFTYKHFGRTLS